jgi:uncharacterized protein YeaO (DUF488 family)
MAQMRRLLDDAGDRPITLIFGAKDHEHNQAIVLREVQVEPDAGQSR